MAKIRKGRLAAAVCLVGVVTAGAVMQSEGDPSSGPDAEALGVEASREAADAGDARPSSRTRAGAVEWSTTTARLASLLEAFPEITVHCLRRYESGSLRLECSMPGRSLRDVARFRDALKAHVLCRGASLESREVQIRTHGTCDQHGDVNDLMVFNLDVAPDAVEAAPDTVAAAEPGMLQLVARCSGGR